MSPGDVVLVQIPQFGGRTTKLRPALVLASLPGPYQNLLLCGISTQLRNPKPNWDELIQPADADYPASALRAASLVRLSYLNAVNVSQVTAVIGRIDAARLQRLQTRLADHLCP